MKFIVAGKLGGLSAIIADDLKTASIEGIGGAVGISWANMRPDHPVVNYINPYGKEEENLRRLMEEKRLEIPKGKIKIAFTDEQKEILCSELKRRHKQFFDDLMAGKIPVKINVSWGDWLHKTLSIDDQPQFGIETWDLAYYLLEEKYHIRENLQFIPEEKLVDGSDVTAEVVTRIKEIEDIKIAENAKAAKRQAKLETEKATMSVKILKQGKNTGDDGTDYYADVKIADPETGESAEFCCRNIFDFGYVINPSYPLGEGVTGGLARKIKKSEFNSTVAAYALAGTDISNAEDDEIWCWQTFDSSKGWYVVRAMTGFEIKAYKYLSRFSPVCKGIRM